MEVIRASREANDRIEQEYPLPDPSRQLPAPEAPQEEPQAGASHVARLRRLQPAPKGFLSVASYTAAGIRVNKSLDRKNPAIQCDEDRRAARYGLGSEVELLAIEGFRYEPARRHWERHDPVIPGANIVTAERFGPELAAKRTGRELG
jgi:hypothetical protein